MKGLNRFKKIAAGVVAAATLYAAPIYAQDKDAVVRQAQVEEEDDLPPQADAGLPDAQLPDAAQADAQVEEQLPDAAVNQPDAALPDAAVNQPDAQPKTQDKTPDQILKELEELEDLDNENTLEQAIACFNVGSDSLEKCADDLILSLDAEITLVDNSTQTTVVRTNNADGYARQRIEENEDRVRNGLGVLRAYIDNQLNDGLNSLRIEGQIALFTEVRQIYEAHNGLMSRVKKLEARKLPASLTIVQQGVEASKTYQALKNAKADALRAELKYDQALLGLTNYSILVKQEVDKATKKGASARELRALFKRLDDVVVKRLEFVDNAKRNLALYVNLTNNLYDSLTGRVTDLADGNYATKDELGELGITAGVRANKEGAYVALGAQGSHNIGNLVLTVFGEGHLGANYVPVSKEEKETQPCHKDSPSEECGGAGLTENRKVKTRVWTSFMPTAQLGARIGYDINAFNGVVTPSLGLLGKIGDSETQTRTEVGSQLFGKNGAVGPIDRTDNLDTENAYETNFALQVELCAGPQNSRVSVCGDYTYDTEARFGEFGLNTKFDF
jgi:hypothetical protein